MAPRSETRDRLLRTAAGLFQEQGYSATGLNQVLSVGQAPKGSMYFHFPGGKEQLGAEAVALSGASLRERLGEVVGAAPDAVSGLAALGEFFARTLEESEFRKGCPVATTALEAAADSEPIRAACDGAYASWQDGLAAALGRWGVAEPEALAAVVLSSLQGALVLARVRRDASVIRTCMEQLGRLV